MDADADADTLRVLVVEDDGRHAARVEACLHQAPIVPTLGLRTARSLAEARALLGQEPADVVLLDLGLPDSAGIGSVSGIAAASAAAIIVLTETDEEVLEEAVLQAGAQDYLVKHRLSPDSLRRAIRHARERKRAADALREQTAFLRSVVDALPIPIFYKDTQGRYQGCNTAFCAFIGRPREQVIGATVYDIAPRELAARYDVKDRELLASPGVQVYEGQVARADGQLRQVVMCKATFVDAYEHVAGLIGAYHDVTDQQRAEQALRGALRSWDATFDAIQDGISLIDLRHRVLRCNQAMARLAGVTPDEALDRCCFELMHGSQEPISDCPLRRARESGHRESIELEHRGRWLRVTVDPLRDERGDFVGGVHIVADITEHRRLQEQVQHAQKTEMLGRLAGGVAHDFNNLLGVIRGNAQMLRDVPPAGAGGDASRGLDLEEILRATEHGERLTRQLLAFARRQVMQTQVLDLNELLERAQRMARRLIAEDVALVLATADEPLRVRVDATQIEQALLNLLVNAYDAVERGSGRIVLEARRAAVSDGVGRGVAAAGWASIQVRDNGHGLSAEARAHLFEPFFTTKERGKGTGLGLATVHGIVNQHGGQISARAVEGGPGTCFEILLPLCDGQPAAVAARTRGQHASPWPQAPGAASGLAIAASPDGAVPDVRPAPRSVAGGAGATTSGGPPALSILLVEDDESLRRAIGRRLRAFGYLVVEASDGPEALATLSGAAADIALVLSDLVMPNTRPSEYLERLVRHRGRRGPLPVVVMSGYIAEPGTARLIEELGLVFIRKPFDNQELMGVLRAALAA